MRVHMIITENQRIAILFWIILVLAQVQQRCFEEKKQGIIPTLFITNTDLVVLCDLYFAEDQIL